MKTNRYLNQKGRPGVPGPEAGANQGGSSAAGRLTVYLGLLLSILAAVGCGPAARPAVPVVQPFEESLGPAPAPPPPVLSGASYVVRGTRYHLLASAAGFTEEGLGAWYGGKAMQGRKTSSGEKFDQNKLTAAHRTLPFGSLVEVRNLGNGQTVVVRVNDRGPFDDAYVIDISLAAAKRIGLLKSGPVALRGLEDPAPSD